LQARNSSGFLEYSGDWVCIGYAEHGEYGVLVGWYSVYFELLVIITVTTYALEM
jgi:hypothetical protein